MDATGGYEETMSNTSTTEDISRRNVLRTGALASIAIAAGRTTIAGSSVASPQNNFGYVKDSTLEGKTVPLAGPPSREKVCCDAGGSESRIKTEKWDLEESGEPLYLIPSGYDAGDTVEVGSVFTFCTRNPDIKGAVSVTKV